MNVRRAFAAASLVVAVFAGSTACGSAASSHPKAAASPSAASQVASTPSGPQKPLPNKNKKLFKVADPCKLLTTRDLQSVLHGSFVNITGASSDIQDEKRQTRSCGFNGSKVKVEEYNTLVAVDMLGVNIDTEIDNQPLGRIWQDLLAQYAPNGHQTIFSNQDEIPNSDALVMDSGNGAAATYQGIIVHVYDQNGRMSARQAAQILLLAMKSLGHRYYNIVEGH